MDFNNMDFNQIFSQAQKIKADFEEKKKDFVKKEFTGTSGGGLVTVTINGDGQFTVLDIDQTIKENAASDRTLEDLVLAAINSAHNDFKSESQDLFSGFANMPGAAEFISE